MKVDIRDRDNRETAFSFEDGRAFDEEGRVKDVNEDKAIQPGDVITIEGGRRDCRVVEVSEDGILAQQQNQGVADLSEGLEIVDWNDVSLWGDRTQWEEQEAAFWANVGPIQPKQSRE